LRYTPITGTIVGIFAGALDGVHAQLIRKTPLGYTVELLESKGIFEQGDRVHLSGREFTIHKAAGRRDHTEVHPVEPAAGHPPNGLRLPAAPLSLPTPVDRSLASLPYAPPQRPRESTAMPPKQPKKKMPKKCTSCDIILERPCLNPDCAGHHNERLGDLCQYCATNQRAAPLYSREVPGLFPSSLADLKDEVQEV
jgi:hypothetical protein